ncbi:helix-turn-helix transcriptional regulator [Streptomyces sp. NPDC046275]|uniref:helix-turn-helix transcriptional regulator n=1 Tax=Streptomyces sp. NPDC046275 TaxID=3157201 RepID=UPI0033F4B274
MTTGDQLPDPRSARTAAEFVAQLRRLKTRSGLTYRELSARATALGEVLPRSTVANMLSRTTLPRDELLAAFVRACGLGPAEAARWEAVRKELAVRGAVEAAGEQDPAEEDPAEEDPAGEASADAGPAPGVEAVPVGAPAGPETLAPPGPKAPAGPEPLALPGPKAPAPPGAPALPGDPPAADPRPPRRLGLVGVIGVAGLVLAAVSVVALVRGGGPEHRGGPGHGGGPVEGAVRIRAVDSGLCLGERRGERSGQVRQLDCAEAGVPRYSLKRLGGDRWRIVTDHPDYGPGCSGLPSGGRIPDAALEDSECGDPTRVEAFTLTPHGSRPSAYRIAPAGSATPGTCVTVTGSPAGEGAALAQAPCRADAKGQLFLFEKAE